MADASPDLLHRAPAGIPLVVCSVSLELGTTLSAEGIVPGTMLEVESTVPFGGPVIIRLGRARIALGRTAAGAVRVVPVR